MIDKVVARYGIKNQDIHEPAYMPGDAILDMRLLNPNSDVLIVIYP